MTASTPHEQVTTYDPITAPIHTAESWVGLQDDWWQGKVDDDRPVPLSRTWEEMDEVMRESGKSQP